MQILPRLGLTSYLCCLLPHSFLTTKRHPSDVEPSYITIFRLIQSVVYPVGVSKDCSCFTQMIDCTVTLRILYRFSPKLVPIIASGRPTSVLNFNWIEVWVCELQQFFQVCKKTTHSYLGNPLRNYLQIWCVVSLGRRAPPQQLWYSSDKRSWSYEYVKIATLLLLLIYSRSLHIPHFLGPYRLT